MAPARFMQRQTRHQGRSTRPEALKHCRKTIYKMSKKIRDVKTCRREVFCERRPKSFAEHPVKQSRGMQPLTPLNRLKNNSKSVWKPSWSCLQASESTCRAAFWSAKRTKSNFLATSPTQHAQKGTQKGPKKDVWTPPNAPDRFKRAIEKHVGTGKR